MKFLARLTNLLRGGLSHWMGGRERRNPAAVYEAAIAQRLGQYGKLREAAAGVLYMRGKIAAEVELKSSALRALNRQIDVAVDRDEDDVALALIQRRTGISADLERLTRELTELNAEAEAAKKNLINFQSDVARLRDEKVRVMAKLANAQARLRLQETIKGLAPDADVQALEEVRAYVERLTAEVQVSREVTDAELAQRLDDIREAESEAAARAELEEIRRVRRRSLVPVTLDDKVAASAPSGTNGNAASAASAATA
jgi:phage shock protein A